MQGSCSGPGGGLSRQRGGYWVAEGITHPVPAAWLEGLGKRSWWTFLRILSHSDLVISFGSSVYLRVFWGGKLQITGL